MGLIQSHNRFQRRMQMVTTNSQSGTNVHEIADGIYRINTPVVMEGGPEDSHSTSTLSLTMSP